MSTANASQAAFAYTWATRLVLFAAFFGLITSFNGFFIAATRVIFASGRGGKAWAKSNRSTELLRTQSSLWD